MAIYFIDEDYAKLYSWILELEFRGKVVIPIGDADRALAALSIAPDIELAVIDVMLASGDIGSQYRESRTEQGLITGLVLLKDLCAIRPDAFPRRALLLTSVATPTVLRRLQEYTGNNSVGLRFKTEIDSPVHFGDTIDVALRRAAQEEESEHHGT